MLLQWIDLTVCPVFCNPHGPNTPFATPLLVVVDVLRVVSVVGALLIVALVLRVFRRVEVSGQRSRFLAFALFALVVANTEMNKIGDYPSLRLPMSLAAVIYAVHGMRSVLTLELPAQPRDRGAGDAA